MPPLVPEVIIWTCVVAFVICVIGGLLVMFEKWTPKDPKVGKRLVYGVVLSVVLAVAGFAGRQFTDSPQAGGGQATVVKQAEVAPATNVAQPARPPETSPPHTPAAPPSAPQPESQSPLEPIPEAFRSWAAEHLGPRADLDPAFDTAYPACIADLRSRATDAIGPSDAEDCRIQLEGHHQRYLVPLYTERSRYGLALRNAQASLARNGLTAENLALFNFLQRENRSFNYADGQAYLRFHSAERRISGDIDLCQEHNCRPPD